MSDPSRRSMVFKIDKESARKMYQHVKDKDDDKVVRPQFEMEAGHLRDELLNVWSVLDLDPPDE